VNGKEVALSAKESSLLCLLAQAPGQVLTRDEIVDKVWGWGFDGTTRTVDNFILCLRQKLEAEPSRPRHINTVRDVGCKLEP
jgi:DNA-binding response OmpR family regulator